MAHELQERYSSMVLAKLRQELILQDGVVFNNDYEGDPKAGAVKIPTRDTEVTAGDYDKANGMTPTTGSTAYATLLINKDKAVNEIIDGYDAAAVPDNLVADRLDSAGYSLARVIDNDGGNVLLAEGSPYNAASIDATNVYATIVGVREAMTKANIPTAGRYLLCTPETISYLLKCDEFVRSTALGDATVQNGAVGRVAGFAVYEWNDATAGLAMIAGHPRFATRVNEWAVPVKLQNLDGSGKYIGASAVQGRYVYAHKVLRAAAVRPVFVPAPLGIAAAAGATAGKTKFTITAAASSTSYKYVVNPTSRQALGGAGTGTALTSGTTEIACAAGDVVEVVGIADGVIVASGYHTMLASEIKA